MKKRVKAGTSKDAAAVRKQKFVSAYIANGLNAKQAAIAAGYAPSGAEAMGSRLTRDSKVAAACGFQIAGVPAIPAQGMATASTGERLEANRIGS